MDWIISDTHFGHKNIIASCERPENHDELMLENWHNLVGKDDTILHLGDVFMGPGSKEFALKHLPDLPGHKSLILGNHDHQPVKFYEEELGFVVMTQPQRMGKKKPHRAIFTHYPLCGDYATWDVNVHGHIHNSGYAPGTPQDRFYVNVSVEQTGYAPVLLADAIEGLVGQQRQDAGEWSFTLTMKMWAKGDRINEHFQELDRCPKV